MSRSNSALIFILLLAFACSPKTSKNESPSLKEIQLDHAVGFKIFQGEGFKLIEVPHAFPGEHKPFSYLVKEAKDIQIPDKQFDAVIDADVQKIILTSTTQIPHLDRLGISDKLIAFPNLDLISSKKIRQHIAKEQVQELGGGAKFNIEKIIDLQPDLVVISTLGDNMKDLQLLSKAHIPNVINGDYLEQHPLGRAEWIKFTGALTGQLEKATELYNEVKSTYENLKKSIEMADLDSIPSVLSGNMYKDIWYAPSGNNWGAIFLKDAGSEYIFKEDLSSGSLQLSYEYVLDKGINADVWISTAEFTDLESMENADHRYTQFNAFQKGQVYTFSLTRGPTGGLEYFELGYSRPDIILKDLIKIFHPEQLPGYKPYFYQKLN
ncbi:ABC transporter substrate-binding protein [Echinicola marina]|uniref:ABC transporter substrate-binding protein n=1 Tax=Echinicola marina TaxID=2859768 RepID=UPI001CF71CE3|nr:ABC transporter substrate-binding protein [Echinicola marina]UCS93457.1 ABC transporter substrate-binding protein [Echinicola marina]